MRKWIIFTIIYVLFVVLSFGICFDYVVKMSRLKNQQHGSDQQVEREEYEDLTGGYYTITYNLDGGIANNPDKYNLFTETFTLNNPTKQGYDFVGWTNSDMTEPTLTVIIAQGSSGNKEFTANYEQKGVKYDNETVNVDFSRYEDRYILSSNAYDAYGEFFNTGTLLFHINDYDLVAHYSGLSNAQKILNSLMKLDYSYTNGVSDEVLAFVEQTSADSSVEMFNLVKLINDAYIGESTAEIDISGMFKILFADGSEYVLNNLTLKVNYGTMVEISEEIVLSTSLIFSQSQTTDLEYSSINFFISVNNVIKANVYFDFDAENSLHGFYSWSEKDIDISEDINSMRKLIADSSPKVYYGFSYENLISLITDIRTQLKEKLQNGTYTLGEYINFVVNDYVDIYNSSDEKIEPACNYVIKVKAEYIDMSF